MGQRGPKPGTVTKPAGSGRKPGQKNRATLEIKELARAYGPKAIGELARLAGLTREPGSDNEGTRVAAIKELIDRGYGRPTQPISGDDSEPPVQLEHSFAGQRVKSMLDQITSK
jgi:hypothetical protein